MTAYIYTFASVIVVSLVSFIGVFALSFKEETLKKYIFLLISLAVGALLGDSLIHLIPEALEHSGNTLVTSLLVIAGVVGFFVLEKFLHWHHHGEDAHEEHLNPTGKLILFSDAIHNFLDGVIIAASFLISVPVGIATTIAVILHEIPQEIGDFAVLVHSGYSRTRALWVNFLSAIFAIAGAIFLFMVGEFAHTLEEWFVPLASGGFIYIAIADLIPELNKTKGVKKSVIQVVTIAVGVLAMAALTLLE